MATIKRFGQAKQLNRLQPWKDRSILNRHHPLNRVQYFSTMKIKYKVTIEAIREDDRRPLHSVNTLIVPSELEGRRPVDGQVSNLLLSAFDRIYRLVEGQTIGSNPPTGRNLTSDEAVVRHFLPHHYEVTQTDKGVHCKSDVGMFVVQDVEDDYKIDAFINKVRQYFGVRFQEVYSITCYGFKEFIVYLKNSQA
jgi:hypothetical protein